MRSGRLLKVPGCGTVRLHHLTAITLVAGTIFAREDAHLLLSKYGKKGHAVTSLVLPTT